jgi:flagellar basal body-associated protein FliL
MLSKKLLFILIAAVLVIGLGIGGYFYWNYSKKSKAEAGVKALENAGSAAETITEKATEGALPSLGTNPIENKPDINPADKANPFKDIKTNPFE